MRHSIIFNPIVDLIDRSLKEKKEYCVIRIPRGQGKTRSIIEILAELLRQNPGWVALGIAGTERQLKEILEDSGYLAECGIKPPEWIKTGAGNYRNINGSTLMFMGAKDSTALSRARGRHPNIIFHDEAQEFNKPRQWMTIFGNMGRSKHCLRIVSGTGGQSPENLLTYVENLIKTKYIDGLVLRKTIDDVLADDEGESKEERLAEFQKACNSQVLVREYDGVSEVVESGEKSPYIRREYYLEDTSEEIKGGLAFPMFSDKNIVDEEYKIDFDRPIYVFSDYGSSDPYGALFFQTDGERVDIFAEMYKTRKDKNWVTFASDLSMTLEALGLASLEHVVQESSTGNKVDIERFKVKFQHKEIYFFGDQHGSNWNPQLSFYFETEFQDVLTAQDGIELIQQFAESRQLRVNITCQNTIRYLKTCTYETDERKRNKFHLEIDHNKSHLITPISYAVQYFMGEGIVPIVRKLEDQPVVQKKEKQKAEYIVPFSTRSNSFNSIL